MSEVADSGVRACRRYDSSIAAQAATAGAASRWRPRARGGARRRARRPPVCAPHSAASSPASSSARHALCCLHALPGAAAAPLAGAPARAASGAGGSAGLAPGGPRAQASAVPASRAGSDVSCVLPAAWTSAASAHGSLSRRCISCATAHRHFCTLHNVHACRLNSQNQASESPTLDSRKRTAPSRCSVTASSSAWRAAAHDCTLLQGAGRRRRGGRGAAPGWRGARAR